MDWSQQQGHILTGGGKIEEYFNPPLFPWNKNELPHYHKVEGDTRKIFEQWKKEGKATTLVAGAWCRPLFVGGWHHSDGHTERTFNLQTPTIFIDLRIPRIDFPNHKSLSSMSDSELSLFARRHCFAGYSVVNDGPWSDENPPVCVRHHAIDWNFTGKMRPRPNKWRIEMREDGQVWKEWGYAKDRQGQHLYMERWERLPQGGAPFLALRRRGAGADAFLLVCGNHFAMAQDRPTQQPFDPAMLDYPGLQPLIDALLKQGNRKLAEEYLQLQGVHGLIASPAAKPWTIDAALHPWLEGSQLLTPGEVKVLPGAGAVEWKGEEWVVVESSLSEEAMRLLFHAGTLSRL